MSACDFKGFFAAISGDMRPFVILYEFGKHEQELNSVYFSGNSQRKVGVA